MAEFPSELNRINALFDQAGAGSPEPQPNPLDLGGIRSETLAQFSRLPGPSKVDQKRESIDQAARAKQIAMAPEEALKTIAAAEFNDNQLAQDQQIRDLLDLSYGELLTKYGPEVADNRARLLTEARQFEESKGRDQRNLGEKLGDGALSFGAGAITGTAGAAAWLNENLNPVQKAAEALGVDAYSIADVGLTQGAAKLSETLKGFQSSETRERREGEAIMAQLDAEDSRKIYDGDISLTNEGGGKGELRAGLEKFGRDFMNSAERILEDPVITQDVVAEGLGSLVPSVVVARGANLAAKGTALEKLAVPGAVGSLEAGGAYSQAVGEVMAMSEEELYLSSPQYAELRDRGESHEEAKIKVASDAGTLAGNIQFLPGAILGKTVEKFELNPIGSATSVGRAAKNVGLQTFEEGAQEGLSSVSTDVALRQTADSDREVGLEAGGAVAAGAIGGLGQAGVTQAPGAALRGAGAVAGAGARAVGQAINTRLETINRQRDEGSVTGRKAMGETITNLQPELETLVQGLDEEIALTTAEAELSGQTASPKQESLQDFRQRADRALHMRGDEMRSTPSVIREMFAEGASDADLTDDLEIYRLAAMQAVAGEIETKKDLTPAQRNQASLWLYDQIAAAKSLADADQSSLPEQWRQTAAGTIQGIDKILSNPTVKAAIETAQGLTSEDLGPMPKITAENVGSREVQDAISVQALMAQSNPAGIDPKFVNEILNQSRNGTVQLSNPIRERLQAAADIHTAMMENETQRAALDQATERQVEALPTEQKSKEAPKKTIESVRRNVMSEGAGKNRMSVEGYFSEVVTAVGKGDLETAKVVGERLRNWAISFENKIRAAEASMKEAPGTDLKYRTWTGEGWVPATSAKAGKIGVNPNSPGSLRFGRAAVIDARTVRDVYNSIATVYGDRLGIEKLPALTVDPILETTEAPAPVTTNRESERVETNQAPAQEAQRGEGTPRPRAPESRAETRVEEARTASAEGATDARDSGTVADPVIEITETTQEELGDYGTVDELSVADAKKILDEARSKTPAERLKAAAWMVRKGIEKGFSMTYVNIFKLKKAAEETPKEARDEVADLIPEILKPFGKITLAELRARVSVKKPAQSLDPKTQEMNDIARRYESDATYSDLAPEQIERVRARIAELSDRFPIDMNKLVKFIAREDGDSRAGTAFWSKSWLAPSDQVIAELGTPSGDHVLIHELGHLIDYEIGADTMVGAHESVLSGRFSGKKGGDLYAEMKAAHEANPNLPGDIGYALEFEDDDIERSRELFAEAVALTLLDPETAQVVIPNAKAFVENLLGIEQQAGQGSEQGSGSQGDAATDGSPASEGGVQTPDAGTEVEAEVPGFENLAGRTTDGLKRFARAYKISFDRSRMLQMKAPLAGTLQLLAGWDTLKSTLELARPMLYDPTLAQRQALGRLVQGEAGNIVKVLNERLKTPQAGTRKMSPLEFYQKALKGEIKRQDGTPIDPTELREFRAFNLVDPTTGEYDPRLAEAAALAAIHWAMNQPTSREVDVSEVAEFFGVDEADVTSDMVREMSRGTYKTRAVESLARTILEFWGAQTNRDVPLSDTRGIAESLAAEIMVAMDGRLVDASVSEMFIEDPENPGEQKKVTIENIVPRAEATEQIVTQVGVAKNFLADVFVPQIEPDFYIGEPAPQKANERQKGNKLGKASRDQQEALKNLRNTAFKVNMPMLGLMTAMGKDTFLKLLGNVEIARDKAGNPTGPFNKNHLLSIEGKNTQLETSWQGVLNHVERVKAYAELNNLDPEAVDSYFDWYIISNERFFAKGFNPQSNKLMRELLVSTVSTLDLTTDKGRELFWLTVAQSSGLVKTEKAFRDEAIARAEKEIYAYYGDAIEALIDWVRQAETNGYETTPMTPDQIEVVSRNLETMATSGPKNAITAKLLHSLVAVAKAEVAAENGTLESFQHNLSLEADGKTDGPINAMVHFLTGNFTLDHVKNLARGGLFLGRLGKTLNSFLNDGSPDLYEVGADKTTTFVVGKAVEIKQFTARPDISAQQKRAGEDALQSMQGLLRLLSHFADVEFDAEKGTLKIKRNGLKNPLTITVYGSRERGIAGKVANEVIDALYARMSELEALKASTGNQNLTLKDLPGLEGYAQLEQDLQQLFTKKAFFNGKEGDFYGWRTTPNLYPGKDKRAPLRAVRGDLKDYSFTRENREMLVSNILELYVKPMSQAIDATIGNVRRTTAMMEAASQVQALVLQQRFSKAVNDLLEQKRRAGELGKSEFLSEADYEKIFQEMRKFGAIVEPIDSNDNHLNLSNKEKKFDKKVQFFGGFNNEFHGPATLASPSEASVSITPQTTISRGDAKMMVNYYASQNPNLRTLEVYDGLEMPADGIDEISQRINESVMQGWLENPLQDVADSFNDFLKQSKDGVFADIEWTDEFSEKFERSMKPLFDPEDRAEMTPDEMVQAINEQLLDRARSQQARKNAMKRIGFSVDHMASGERPADHLGQTFESDEETLAALQQAYKEELAKLTQGDKDLSARSRKDGTEKPNPVLERAVTLFGRPLKNRKGEETLRQLSPDELVKMMLSEDVRKSGTVDPQAVKILNQIAKMTPGFRFMFGPAEDLNAWRNRNYPEHANAAPLDGRTILAQTDPQNGIVYIANTATESILHEALHTALLRQMLDYFGGNQDRLSDTQKAALGNLKKLQSQFLNLTFQNEVDLQTREATDLAQSEIQLYLERGTPQGEAYAMAEFVSWALANQKVSKALKKTKVRVRLEALRDAALKGIRKLFGLPEQTKLDMFSNIAFNAAAVLMAEGSGPQNPGGGRPLDLGSSDASPSVLINQVSRLTGEQKANNLRLENLAKAFDAKVRAHLRKRVVPGYDEMLGTQTGSSREEVQIRSLANDAVTLFTEHGFTFTPAEQSAFRSIQAAMASLMELDATALVRMQRLYAHVMDNLTPAAFLENPENAGRDPDDNSDWTQATEKFNLLAGKFGNLQDAGNRSILLASFVALSQVHPEFRKMLRDLPVPKDREVSFKSADEFVDSVGESLMNTLSSVLSGEGARSALTQSKRTLDVLDQLTLVLAKIENDDQNYIERKVNGLLDSGDTRASNFLVSGADKLSNWSLAQRQKATQDTTELRKRTRLAIAGSVNLLTAAMDAKRGEALAQTTQGFLNQAEGRLSMRAARETLRNFREVMNEIIGITDETRPVLELMNKGKRMISSVRQDYREKVPENLKAAFSRELTKREWEQLHLVLGKGDIAALDRMTPEAIRTLLSDSAARAAAIATQRGNLSSLVTDPVILQRLETKMDELARFMMTGEIDPSNFNFLKNAEAIARLLGEPGIKKEAKPKVTKDLVRAIDELTTLKALDFLSKKDPVGFQEVVALAQVEAEGMDTLVRYLSDVRDGELKKAQSRNREATFNYYKGYMPAEVRDGASVIVADDSEQKKLETLGYKRVGDYAGSVFDRGSKGYYYSTVGGNGTFNQGIMQTVQTSVAGVDPRTGRTVTGTTGGVITGTAAGLIKQRVRTGQYRAQGEPLMPIFDEEGEVVAWERHMDPVMLEKARPNRDIAEMLGAWAGRQVEEELAQEHNRVLVDRLHAMWEEGRKAGKASEFVNMLSTTDPVYLDAWKMVPREAKEYIDEVYGQDGAGFYVRRDLIENALGFRDPSIGDAWIGASRWNDKTKKAFSDAATVIAGKDAYRYLVTAEKAWQAGVSVAKNTIVIRSVVVPVANFASNFFQLMTRGVNPLTIPKSFARHLIEINQFLRNEERRIEIQMKMARHRGEPVMLARLESQLQSLEDMNRRMTIWPLIEAGEFNTISEGLTEADAAIGQGKWAEYMNTLIDKAGKAAGDVGRYALVTRDTALFQGMSRAVQYGDFLAKATLYEKLTKKDGLSSEEAMKRVTEEFVNYNFNWGRGRTYGEKMGLTWFWAYKLRSIKVALNTVRDNPLRALIMTNMMPVLPDLPGISVGMPIEDNAISVIADGRAEYSLGTNMLFSAPSLNPWYSLIFK